MRRLRCALTALFILCYCIYRVNSLVVPKVSRAHKLSGPPQRVTTCRLFSSPPSGSSSSSVQSLTGEEIVNLASTSESNLAQVQSPKVSELIETTFQNIISSSQAENVKDALLRSINEKGIAALREVQRPTNRDEAWKHNNVKTLFGSISLAKKSIKSNVKKDVDVIPHIDEECRGRCFVFVDGEYSPDLSEIKEVNSDCVGFLHFSSTIDSGFNKGLPAGEFPDFLSDDNKIAHIPDSNEIKRNSYASDALSAMNMAACEGVTVLHAKRGKHHDEPIQVLNIVTLPSLVSPRLLVVMEEGSEMSLRHSFVGGSDNQGTEESNSIVNSNTRVILEKEAKLQHTYMQDMSISTRHMEVLSSECDTNADYSLNIVQMGGVTSRFNAHMDLKQTESNCSISCVALSTEKQSMDLHSSIVHDAENAISRQQQRNVIGDRGEVIFKGRIRIPAHAQLTDSDQLCRTLLLGSRARIIAMPTLEITADNVVCSHGASVADMDENSMFYMLSRGIKRTEARKLLLRGFVFEVLEDAVLDKKAQARIIEKLVSMNPESNTFAKDGPQAFTSM